MFNFVKFKGSTSIGFAKRVEETVMGQMSGNELFAPTGWQKVGK
jgi:hypothetical protein